MDLPKQKFELLAVMEGTNETSNAKFQARTSYLPQGERRHWLQDMKEIFSKYS